MQRNKEPILKVLKNHLRHVKSVLEIASGSGEHCIYFANHLNHIQFTPSDYSPEALLSIRDHVADSGLLNINPYVHIDVCQSSWPVDIVDAILCINMVHISAWEATKALFANGRDYVFENGYIILYGPYFEYGVEPAPTNASFHRSLKARNAQWGIRYAEDVASEASRNGFKMIEKLKMPSNNMILIFEKLGGK